MGAILEGFERFDIRDAAPSMTVDENGVTFNKTVTEQLGNPQRVYCLVDEKYKRIAIEGCEADDDQGFDFWSPEDASQETIRWETRSLAQKLESLGSLDLKHNNYELTGYLIDQEDAMFFDLHTARSVPKK